MAFRQREWARKKIVEMREQLGGKCQVCGSAEDLCFDCKLPMGKEHHKIEWSARISFYRWNLANGNLQLLCRECNGRKGWNDALMLKERYGIETA